MFVYEKDGKSTARLSKALCVSKFVFTPSPGDGGFNIECLCLQNKVSDKNRKSGSRSAFLRHVRIDN